MNPISIPREFYIPSDTDVIFVSDFFVEDYVGGAELTLQAIYDATPSELKKQKIHSSSVTEEMIYNNKDKLWILVNYCNVPKDVLSHFVLNKCTYVIIECDYKMCKYRSEHHHLHITGKPCDCSESKEYGLWTEAFFKRSKKVFFMSESQMNRYKTHFPKMQAWTNMCVQKSTWNKNDLEYLSSLAESRKEEHNGKWAILQGVSWIKNQIGSEQYCKQNNMPYDVIPKMEYKAFLKELSKYKGLVFHPTGYDTCPRIVIESKLIGLELDLNDNVEMRYEEWFAKRNREELLSDLSELPEVFWKVLFDAQ